ncbi:pyruvate dehydrogenase E2 component [Mycoplasmopsis maculosa]|uniref:Dihydrolipoyl dehydrogenase n=1 Tax=Mycoplasmopsis maculosa TaxID=114885 RepID=A0A449B592_9BACT|nr:dihydrolipoyl dehydrogenase [Mycoplasmopsis maculosa]VEU75773.1 pyruvate dehydrogenase E2 component [Mycoplasmopsis maculosa]
MYKFKFADIGEGLHEGTVGDIFVKVGDKVNEGDSLFSVETDKVASDIPSPVTGIIKEIKMAKGDVIHVGQEIFVIDDGSSNNETTIESKKEEIKELKQTTSTGKSIFSFKFADIGEGLHEGTVGDIFVKVGDKVNEGDSLFSVETDKVASDIPSPVTGIIKEIKMNKGDVIHVGQEIFLIEHEGDGQQLTTENKQENSPVEEEKCLVGDAPNSNELIDLNFNFSSSKSSETKENVVKEETKTNSNNLFETGKIFSGKIDEEFDVIIVGSGPGGYLAAEEAGKSGLKTLIIEKEFWGGVCLNIGCIPTKAMLESIHVLDKINHAEKYGIIGNFDKLKIDKNQTWIKMHERKAKVVSQISSSVKMLMKSSKCSIIDGEAKFVGAHEVEVNGKVYKGKNIILATGSHSRRLMQVKGFENGYKTGKLITSREAINYDKKLPESIVIIGGGVIGVEFAQVFATSGSKVTILQREDHLLPGVDKDVVAELEKSLKAEGIEIIFNASSTGINEKDELEYEHKGETKTISASVYLLAVGRVPASEGLEEVGIKLGKMKEVVVDEYMRTNVQNVYAIGDLVGQNMLAHVAYNHALIAVANIRGDQSVKNYVNKPVPGCIFTSPEIAIVGLTEEQAKEKGYDAFSTKYSFSYLGKSIATSATTGFAKLVVDREYGQILGAHIIGANSTDYISEIALAIEQEVSVKELTYTIHPHPTYGEILWEAARSAELKLELEKHKK